jgi:hypothetical protein
LYYSAATKDEAKPNELISLESLAEIEMNHRSLALDLIHLLIKGEDGLKLEIATLLRHPLFIRSSEDGKARLIKELTDGEMCHDWNSKKKLQKWRASKIKGKKLQRGDFDDLADIVLIIYQMIKAIMEFKFSEISYSFFQKQRISAN